jgi:hypothetical protein
MKLKPHPVLGTFAALLLAFPAYSIVLRHLSVHGDPTLRYAALGKVGDGAGVLVAPRWVVASLEHARSITPFDPQVTFGCALAHAERRPADVDLVLPHPEGADLALLRLVEPVTGVPPMLLYGKGDEAGLDLLHCGCDGPPAAASVERSTGEVLELDVPEVSNLLVADDAAGLTLVGVGAYRHSAESERRALRVSHFREWIRRAMQEHADSPTALGVPRPVEGALPEGELTECARAFFAAYGSGDLERLRAFELAYRAEDQLEDVDTRLAELRRHMITWGPLEPREVAVGPSGDVWVLARSESSRREIAFRFEQAGEPLRLVSLTHSER